jgi:hypothetical protein
MSWAWSDAWVLTAAYVAARNPVSLSDVVAAGDFINHAIFTDEELEHAFTRLTAAGLVELQGDVVVLSDEALALCREAVERAGGVLTATANVDRALREIQLGELTPIAIAPGILDAAIERYVAGHGPPV